MSKQKKSERPVAAATTCSGLGRADANQKAWSMSYEDRLALVKQHEWRSSGHWDNWFHPVSGWNYSLHGAVVSILMYPPNA